MMRSANDRATGMMSGKVMAGRSVSTVHGTPYGMAPLNSGGNPSMNNGNSPPREPKTHGYDGPQQVPPHIPGPKIGR
jgi:hypothetical protein